MRRQTRAAWCTRCSVHGSANLRSGHGVPLPPRASAFCSSTAALTCCREGAGPRAACRLARLRLQPRLVVARLHARGHALPEGALLLRPRQRGPARQDRAGAAPRRAAVLSDVALSLHVALVGVHAAGCATARASLSPRARCGMWRVLACRCERACAPGAPAV
jgi:hypothetical protein